MCIYIQMYEYTNTYVNIFICTCLQMFTDTCMYRYVYLYFYICTCIRLVNFLGTIKWEDRVHLHQCVCACVCMSMCSRERQETTRREKFKRRIRQFYELIPQISRSVDPHRDHPPNRHSMRIHTPTDKQTKQNQNINTHSHTRTRTRTHTHAHTHT